MMSPPLFVLGDKGGAIVPIAVVTGFAVTDSLPFTHNHNCGLRLKLLDPWDGADEGVATAIGLDVAVHKGDEFVRVGNGQVVVDFEGEFFDVSGGSGSIRDAIVNDGKAMVKPFRVGAFLKGRWAYVPGGVIKIKQGISVFEMNPA